MKKNDSFFESLLKTITFMGIAAASEDSKGKTDPYKAAGIAYGLGYDSFENRMKLAEILGGSEAFDKDSDND